MEILKSFGIQPTLLLAQIVNFLIILYLLKRFFYKPIVKILEDRKKRIEESLQNAQSIEERLQITEEETKKIIEQARANTQSLIDDAKNEARRITDEATSEGRKLIEAAKLEAKSQIEAQRIQMQRQLEKQTLNLVITVVRKILGKSIKNTQRQQLTAEAVSEISRKVQ